MSIASEHMKTEAYGGAEGIFVSVKPAMKSDSVSLCHPLKCSDLSLIGFLVYVIDISTT